MRSLPYPLPLVALAIAAPASAQQTVPVPAATVPPEASVLPPPVAVLPTPTPTPDRVPEIAPAAPVTSPSPRPRVIVPTAPVAPTPTPTPTPTSTPTAVPTSVATAAPAAVPVPIATPTAEPTPAADVAPLAAPPVVEGGGGGWWPVVAILAAVALAALLLLRRRGRGRGERVEEAEDLRVEAPASPVVAPPVVPAAPATRAWLAVDLRARRAGVNMVTATLDAEVTVRNDGDAPARDVRLDVRLLSAHAAQDAELEQLAAAPSARPAVVPFTLAPGEARTVTVLATLPRSDIRLLGDGARPVFVPVAVVSLRYGTGGGAGQTAAAFAIGIERAGAEKLSPVRLDTPSAMHEGVAVRRHAWGIRR